MPVDIPVLMAKCKTSLVTSNPFDAVKAMHFFRELMMRAVGYSQETKGMCIYEIEDCDEIDAGAILLLMHAGYCLQKRGWMTRIAGHGEAMDLVVKHLQHFLHGKKRDSRSSGITGDEDYLLRKIDSKDTMVREVAEWAALVQTQTRADEENLALWQFQISEVTTNSFQHGHRGNPDEHRILIAGKAIPEQKMVQLAVLDNGGTIPETIRETANRRTISNKDGNRIRFACGRGITSKSEPTNQGVGLSSLAETVKKNEGSLLIVSRNGLFSIENTRSKVRNFSEDSFPGPFLQGTLTLVNLRV